MFSSSEVLPLCFYQFVVLLGYCISRGPGLVGRHGDMKQGLVMRIMNWNSRYLYCLFASIQTGHRKDGWVLVVFVFCIQI